MATKEFLRKLRQKYKLGEYKVSPRQTKRARKRSVIRMAKYRRSRGSSFGGGKLSRGFYSPKGIFASALIGAGAATLAEKVLPNVIPYQGAIIGFAVGGIGGAGGALARDLLRGISLGQTGINNPAYM